MNTQSEATEETLGKTKHEKTSPTTNPERVHGTVSRSERNPTRDRESGGRRLGAEGMATESGGPQKLKLKTRRVRARMEQGEDGGAMRRTKSGERGKARAGCGKLESLCSRSRRLSCLYSPQPSQQGTLRLFWFG